MTHAQTRKHKWLKKHINRTYKSPQKSQPYEIGCHGTSSLNHPQQLVWEGMETNWCLLVVWWHPLGDGGFTTNSKRLVDTAFKSLCIRTMFPSSHFCYQVKTPHDFWKPSQVVWMILKGTTKQITPKHSCLEDAISNSGRQNTGIRQGLCIIQKTCQTGNDWST